MCKKILSLLCLLLFLDAAPAAARNFAVAVGPSGSFMFSPMSLNIAAGDTVTFTSSSNISHNVHSDIADSMQFECAKGCTGDGSGGNGTPVPGPWSATVTFPNAGTFNYQCDVHVSFGMTGTIKVTGVVASPDFSLTAASSNPGVTQGSDAMDDISITPLNGFAGGVTLAASGLPSGVTASFNSTDSTSSTLILSADATAAIGPATITITGTSGSLSHAISLNLTVNAAAPFAITPGLTGAWYNNTQSGQGFNVEVLANNRLDAFWYVFDSNGNNLWLTGVGNYSGNTATLNIIQTTGGLFPPAFDPTQIVRGNWGTLTLTFTDCNNGTATWTPIDTTHFSSGTLAITRLTNVGGLACP